MTTTEERLRSIARRRDGGLTRFGLSAAAEIVAGLFSEIDHDAYCDVTIHGHPRIGADIEIHVWPATTPHRRPNGGEVSPRDRTLARVEAWSVVLGNPVVTPVPRVDPRKGTHPDPGLRQVRGERDGVTVRVWTRLDDPGRCTCPDCPAGGDE